MSSAGPREPFAVVVLAAGGSSRMGRAKQLLPYLGQTLVEHAARTALRSGASEVIVVVGAQADEVRALLRNLPVRIVTNRDWEQGMGGSIAAGVAALSENVEATIVALADQPRITPEHLRALGRRVLHGQPVVASEYDGVIGAPCAFGRSEFDALQALSGDEGARKLIRGRPVETLVFAEANVDVDTPVQYRTLVPAIDDEIFPEPEEDTDGVRAPPFAS